MLGARKTGQKAENTPAAEPPETAPDTIPDTIPDTPPGADAVPDTDTDAPGELVLGRTRISWTWVAVVATAIVLVLLLVFILQNGENVKVSFLGANGSLPLGVALLLAAVLGVLLAALPAAFRIMQLRRTARRAFKR